VSCCEKLVAEAGDSSETRGKGTSSVESRYRATASKDVTMDINVCVRVHVFACVWVCM
jgi:hypothetical protein